MGIKVVSIIDENGYFTGIDYADESPREPGCYLLPNNAVEISPPEDVDNKRAIYNKDSNSWDYEDNPRELAIFKKHLVIWLLDCIAQQMGYDNILSAVSYAEEPSVERYQKEGQALRKWRSLVWEQYWILCEQNIPMTDKEFYEALPRLERL